MGKLKELCDEASRYRLDIVGVQEVIWGGQGKLRISGGMSFNYSGRVTEDHSSGVGLLLYSAAARALESYGRISDHLLTARVNCGIIRMTIVVCYAPTDVAEAEEKDQFYQSFEEVLQSVHMHDLHVVIGDFNARVGNMRNGFKLFLGPHAVPGPTNDNGQRLLDTCMCAANNLVIGGSLFLHRLIHKYTWTSSAGTRPRAQLDHVLINTWWRRSLLDCSTYWGADIGSDHDLVVAKLRFKLANANRPKTTRRLDMEKLRDESYLKEYREDVNRRFTGIDMAQCSVEEGWRSWWDTVKGTAEYTIGPRKKRHRPWISKTTKSLELERQKAKVAKDQLASRSQLEKYRTLERQVKDSARKDKQKWMDTIGDDMETAAQRGEYQQLSGKFPTDAPPVEGEDDTPLDDREQVKAR